MGLDGKSLITPDGWFMEKNDMWPGQAMSLKVKEVLYHGKSSLQDVLIFDSETYGRVLVLDGVIQLTERDNHAYHEMMSNLPLYAHSNPKQVLVIGGGDGGIIREVLKHDVVERVTLCEIDSDVIDKTKEFIPSVSAGCFDSAKVSVVIEDGFKFLDRNISAFDVIITDSSDPVGPAKVLFERPFYERLHKSLKPGGILCSQGECMWLHFNWITPLLDVCRSLFPVVDYAYTCIPTYPSGQIGFIICSKDESANLRVPQRTQHANEIARTLSYYNPDIHRAAFVLPEFARRIVEGEVKVAPENEVKSE